jgi:1-acyl-sn-glycerol-3-phosphate acyltransferase
MRDQKLRIKHNKFYLFFYDILRFILRVIFKILYRVEAIDIDKAPKKGRIIICSNHMSYVDPVVIGAFIPRCIYFMAKNELYGNRFISSLVTYLNAFPVKRNSFDRSAFKTSLEILKNDNVLGLFPEGTRSTDGILRNGKKGTGFISVSSRTSILPVALSGTNMIIQKPRKRLFFPKIKIIVGDLINIDEILKNYSKKEAMHVVVSKLMEEIGRIYSKIK